MIDLTSLLLRMRGALLPACLGMAAASPWKCGAGVINLARHIGDATTSGGASR